MRVGPPPYEVANNKDLGELAEPLRSRLAQMIADAPRRGLVLVSGKRTDYQQYMLRVGRVPRGQEWNPAYKGRPLTAIPGRSNHRNLSADIAAADIGGRDLAWARANAHRYGLHFPIPSEDWHAEPHGTPTVPITPYRPTSHTPQEPLMVTAADEAKIRKIVREEVDRGAMITVDAVDRRYGSLRGWVAAIGARLGVTRSQAAAGDTYTHPPKG